MAKKKIVRKPIEKLSEKEAIVEIEDSSSEEEVEDELPDIVVPPPSKLTKPKRERSPAQLANDQRLRDLAKARKAKKIDKVIDNDLSLDTTLYKGTPIKKTPKTEPKPDLDPDDMPMTVKQMKAFMQSQKHVEPVVVKPKRKYNKKIKEQAPAPITSTSTNGICLIIFSLFYV